MEENKKQIDEQQLEEVAGGALNRCSKCGDSEVAAAGRNKLF